jgi:hypothetical protein
MPERLSAVKGFFNEFSDLRKIKLPTILCQIVGIGLFKDHERFFLRQPLDINDGTA